MRKELTGEEKAILVAMADDISEACAFTDEEVKNAVEILNKIACCQDNGFNMPGKVFEAHTRSKKNISSELVLLNKKGQFYLIQRPDKKENPSDPYAGQWHFPGVTHMKNETTQETINRLTKMEIGVAIANVKQIATAESNEKLRSMYLMQIFIADVGTEIPKNPKSRFFDIKNLPKNMINSHRNIILPAALNFLKMKNS